uniref:Uncharacterized protein n=1 Tax=Calcidiscus leptoporus TaxID=127549 RepID=A0A7S0IKM7_9EUKA
MDSLIDACVRMVGQLELLDPAFFKCFDYHGYGRPRSAEEVHFLGRDIYSDIKAVYQPTNRSETADERLAQASPAVKKKFQTLYLCNQGLELGLCSRADRHWQNAAMLSKANNSR